MPNKCQVCWNYGKSIMYCIFKCCEDEKKKKLKEVVDDERLHKR